MHNEIGWPDCQMAIPLGMVVRWQIIRWSCIYMRTSNLDMVLFTIHLLQEGSGRGSNNSNRKRNRKKLLVACGLVGPKFWATVAKFFLDIIGR